MDGERDRSGLLFGRVFLLLSVRNDLDHISADTDRQHYNTRT